MKLHEIVGKAAIYSHTIEGQILLSFMLTSALTWVWSDEGCRRHPWEKDSVSIKVGNLLHFQFCSFSLFFLIYILILSFKRIHKRLYFILDSLITSKNTIHVDRFLQNCYVVVVSQSCTILKINLSQALENFTKK